MSTYERDQGGVQSSADPLSMMKACVGYARQLEDLSIQLDDARKVKETAINNADKAQQDANRAAESARSGVLSSIYSGCSMIGVPQKEGIGTLPPKEHRDLAGLSTKLTEIAREVTKVKSQIADHETATKSKMQGIWVGSVIATVILMCGMKFLALGCLLIPIGWMYFRSTGKDSLSHQLTILTNDFYQTAQSLDEGSRFQLSEAKKAASAVHEAALRDAESAFAAKSSQIDKEMASVESVLSAMIRELDRGVIQGDWRDPDWDRWQPSDRTPHCLRLGHVQPVMPRYEANFPAKPPIAIPSFVNYQSGKGLVVEADSGLEEAHKLAQGIVLRLLATVPPAGVRFTFIDPVSLGRNVAAFMSLEKHEPTLIGGKAWSDSQHIDRALAEITEHMETVIQKYLREDYETIEDYNKTARVKEAYRVVMVFDFPVNFSDTAAKRLVSIMRNGPKCGVFPVVIVDKTKPAPYGFNVNDLEQFALVFRASGLKRAGGKAIVEDSSQTVRIQIERVGGNELGVLKTLREFTGLGIKEVKDALDRLPASLSANLKADKARDLESALSDAGATAVVSLASAPPVFDKA